jgi:hypothetical protein
MAWMTLSVEDASRILMMSPRRLRTLLAQGRVQGYQDYPGGPWKVVYPFIRTPGKRGPEMRYYPVPRKGRPSKRRKRRDG